MLYDSSSSFWLVQLFVFDDLRFEESFLLIHDSSYLVFRVAHSMSSRKSPSHNLISLVNPYDFSPESLFLPTLLESSLSSVYVRGLGTSLLRFIAGTRPLPSFCLPPFFPNGLSVNPVRSVTWFHLFSPTYLFFFFHWVFSPYPLWLNRIFPLLVSVFFFSIPPLTGGCSPWLSLPSTEFRSHRELCCSPKSFSVE